MLNIKQSFKSRHSRHAWKIVSRKSVQGDSTTTYDDKTRDVIKIVTPTHFAIFSNNVANDSLEVAGAGPIA